MTKRLTIHTTQGEAVDAVDRGDARLSDAGEAHAEALAAELLHARRTPPSRAPAPWRATVPARRRSRAEHGLVGSRLPWREVKAKARAAAEAERTGQIR
jgi:hypothetical protein